VAIALDASTPAGVWGDTAANTSLVTASFTPPSGSIVIAFVYSAGGDQTHGTPTGLTFTAGPTVGTTSSTTKVSAFTATGGGSAITVTETFSGTAEWRGLVVSVWTGAQLGSATNTVLGGSGAPTGTITTTGTNSVVVWANGDWNGDVSTGRAYRSSATEIAYHNIPTNVMSEYAAYQAAATAGSQTYGLTAPTNQVYNLVALELQVASAASAPARRPQAITRVSGIRAATY
jgi:hypothetical protein